MHCTFKRLFLKRSGLGIYSAFLAHQAASIALSFPIDSDFFLAYYPWVENIEAFKDLNPIKIDVETYYDIKINKIYDNSPIMKLEELIYKQIQKSLQFTIANEIHYQKWNLQGLSVDLNQLRQFFFMYRSLVL